MMMVIIMMPISFVRSMRYIFLNREVKQTSKRIQIMTIAMAMLPYLNLEVIALVKKEEKVLTQNEKIQRLIDILVLYEICLTIMLKHSHDLLKSKPHPYLLIHTLKVTLTALTI